MAEFVCYYTGIGGYHPLNNFAEVPAVRLDLSNEDSGFYMVWGRVAIFNYDPDAQNVVARITSLDGKIEIDRVSARIPGKGESHEVISLQGVLELHKMSPPRCLQLLCNTYDGAANQARLQVLRVEGITDKGF